MSLYDVLDLMQANTIVLLLFFLSLALYKENGTRSSIVASLTILCVLSVAHLCFDIAYWKMLKYSDNPWLLHRLWYIFYLATDVFAALLIYLKLKKNKLNSGMVAYLISLVLVVRASMQLIDYIFVFGFGSDLFGSFYEIAIPSINLLLLFVVGFRVVTGRV